MHCTLTCKVTQSATLYFLLIVIIALTGCSSFIPKQTDLAEIAATHTQIIYDKTQLEDNTPTVVPPDSVTPDTITIACGGDVSFARGIDSYLSSEGYENAFGDVADILKNADLSIINLECALADDATPLASKVESEDIVLIANTKSSASLQTAGIDIVGLANNHAKDAGESGIEKELTLLDEMEIQHTGAGLTKEQAYKPVYTTIKNVKIGYMALCDVIPPDFLASSYSSGIATGRVNTDYAMGKIAEAHDNCDFLIVGYHWGTEYTHTVDNKTQTTYAEEVIDAGADLIVAGHSHYLQGIDYYENVPIVYSLGNLVFDLSKPDCHESIIVEASLNKDGQLLGIQLIPVYLNDVGIPYIAHEKTEELVTNLETYSIDMKTRYIQEDDGTISIQEIK